MAHKIVTLSAIFLFAFVGNKLIAQEAVVASGYLNMQFYIY